MHACTVWPPGRLHARTHGLAPRPPPRTHARTHARTHTIYLPQASLMHARMHARFVAQAARTHGLALRPPLQAHTISFADQSRLFWVRFTWFGSGPPDLVPARQDSYCSTICGPAWVKSLRVHGMLQGAGCMAVGSVLRLAGTDKPTDKGKEQP